MPRTHLTTRIGTDLLARIEATKPHGFTRSAWVEHLLGNQLDFIAKAASGEFRPRARNPVMQSESGFEAIQEAKETGQHWEPVDF